MICRFEPTPGGCRCARCGRGVRGHDGRGLVAECHARCVHLGQATGELVAVACRTCDGQAATRDYPVHRCARLGECLPDYRCTKDALAESASRDVDACASCELFVARALDGKSARPA